MYRGEYGAEYDKKYAEWLIKKGFRPADEYAEQVLKEAGIKFNDDEAEQQAASEQSTQPSLNNPVKVSAKTKTANDLVKEGFALLEHSSFEQAEQLFGQALDINSGISSAYIYNPVLWLACFLKYKHADKILLGSIPSLYVIARLYVAMFIGFQSSSEFLIHIVSFFFDVYRHQIMEIVGMILLLWFGLQVIFI